MLKTKRANYVLPVKHIHGNIYNNMAYYEKVRTLPRINAIQYYVPLSYEREMCLPNQEVGFPYVLRPLRLEKNLEFLSQAERLDIMKITSRIRCGPTRRHKDSKYLLDGISALLRSKKDNCSNRRSKRSERSIRQKEMYDLIKKHIISNIKEASKCDSVSDVMRGILKLFRSCLNYRIVGGTTSDTIFSRRMRIIMASIVIKECLRNKMKAIATLLLEEMTEYSDEQLGVIDSSSYYPVLRSCLIVESYLSGSRRFFSPQSVLRFVESKSIPMNEIIFNATVFTRMSDQELVSIPTVLSDYLKSGTKLYPSTINRCIISIIRRYNFPMNLRYDLIKKMIFIIFKMPFHVENIYVDETAPVPLCRPPTKVISFDGNRSRKKLLVNCNTFRVLGRGTNSTELAMLLIERAEYYGFLRYTDIQIELLRLLLRTNVATRRSLHMDFIKRLTISDSPCAPKLASELIRHIRSDYLLPGLINYLGRSGVIRHKVEKHSIGSCIYNMCMNYPSSIIFVSWLFETLETFGLPLSASRILSTIKILARFGELYIVYMLYLDFLRFLGLPTSGINSPLVLYNTSKCIKLSKLTETIIIDPTSPVLSNYRKNLYGPNLSPLAITRIRRTFLFEIALGHSLDSPLTLHMARTFKNDPQAFRYILRGVAGYYTYSNILPNVFRFVVKTGLKFDPEYMKHILAVMYTRVDSNDTIETEMKLRFSNCVDAVRALIESTSFSNGVEDSCKQLMSLKNA